MGPIGAAVAALGVLLFIVGVILLLMGVTSRGSMDTQ